MARAMTAKRSKEPSRQEGFALIEVVVASVVLLVVLVPSAYLITSSSSLLTTNRSKTVAANLASSQLEEDRSVADSETWSTTSSSPCLGLCPTLPGPTSPATSSSTVGDTTYTVTQSVGWCADLEVSGTWTWQNYSSAPTDNPAAYGILAKVSWQGGSVSVGTVLPTPNAQLSSVPSSSSSTCPL